MKGIIIGAGRGSRLMPYTTEQPKCFAEIGERRILDWVLEALRGGGLEDITYIGGYRIDDVRRHYGELRFRHNDRWPDNNILASLFYAEDDMADGFVSSYSDIVFRPEAVRAVIDHPADIVLCVDTAWRARYLKRSQHPEHDAEKVTADGSRLVKVSRTIASEDATGEFIGVAKFSPRGAGLLREHFHECAERLGPEAPFQGAASFEKAYLIHLIQVMIERGVEVHHAPIEGGYFEIDTTEDYNIAKAEWPNMAAAEQAS